MKQRTAEHVETFFARHADLTGLRAAILEGCALVHGCLASGGKLLACGNGGSCADADHIVGELMKGFLLRRPLPEAERAAWQETFGVRGQEIAKALQQGIPALSLGAQGALSSAFQNDVDSTLVYAQQAYAYARPGDLLVGISTSGNAENVCAAAMAARMRGAKVLGLTGRDGGRLAPLCDLALIVPEQETFCIQEAHLRIYHLLCAYVESELFES